MTPLDLTAIDQALAEARDWLSRAAGAEEPDHGYVASDHGYVASCTALSRAYSALASTLLQRAGLVLQAAIQEETLQRIADALTAPTTDPVELAATHGVRHWARDAYQEALHMTENPDRRTLLRARVIDDLMAERDALLEVIRRRVAGRAEDVEAGAQP